MEPATAINTVETSGKTASASYAASGAVTQSTDFLGHATNLANNVAGGATGATNTIGSVTQAAYGGGAKAYPTPLPTDQVNGNGLNTMTDYNPQGLPIATSTPIPLGDNMIPNPSFEFLTNGFPTDWTAGGTGTVSAVTSPVKFGNEALQLTASGTEQAYAFTNDVPVTPGAPYLLSYWTQTQGVSNSGNTGVRLDVHWFTNTSGSSAGTTFNVAAANGTSNGWVAESGLVTAPANAAYAEVDVTLANPGTATVDGVSMTAENPNLIVNGNFTQGVQSGAPDSWTTEVGSGLVFNGGLDTSNLYQGQPSLALVGNTGTEALDQTAISAGPYGDTGAWVISGWSQAAGPVATTNVANGIVYGLVLKFYYNGNLTTPGTVDVVPITPSSAWKLWSAVLTPTAGETLSQVTAQVAFSGQPGTAEAWFTNVQLQALPGSGEPSVSPNVVSAFNLVPNGGFEADDQTPNWPDFWTNDATSAGGSAAESSTAFTGRVGLQITPPPTSSITPARVVSTWQQPVAAGQDYTAVGYVMTQNLGSDAAGIAVAAYNSSGTVLGWTTSALVGHTTADRTTGTVGWTRVDVPIAVNSLPAGTTAIAVAAVVNPANGGAATFDDLALYAGNRWTTQTYDPYGLVSSTTPPAGGTTSFVNNDSTGTVSSATLPNGTTESFGYNPNNWLASVTYPANGANQTFTYGYDANGNLTAITDPVGGQITQTYTPLNQLASTQWTVNGTAETTTFGYDAAGDPTQIANPNGTSEALSYNAAHQVTQDSYALNGTTQQTLGYSYDLNGDLTGISVNGTAAQQYTYDPNGNLTMVSTPADGETNTQAITYNPAGQPTQWTATVNSTGTSPTTWNTTTLYDQAGNIRTVSDMGTGVSLAYATNAFGGVAQVMDPAHTSTAYTTTTAGQIASVTVQPSGASPSVQDQYTYDASGNLTQITNVLTGQTETFTYNGLNELTQETLFNGTTISYTYDALGNILTQTVTPSGGQPTTTTYGYDTEHNQLTSINGVAVTSDANGNITNDGTNSYTWTAANQLASVGTPSGTLSITDDGLGRPSQFTTPSGHVEQLHYIGTSNNPAYLTDGSNNVVARWTYGPNGLPALMAVNVSGSWDTYEYVYNGLNDVTGLIDLTSGSATYGQMVVQYQYDAYGNTLSTTDTSGVTVLGQGLAAFNPFQYRGYYQLPGTNLYDLGARVYNPAWGRFISRDPSGYSAGDITGYNGYSYAADNPMTFIDPTGLRPYLGRKAPSVTVPLSTVIQVGLLLLSVVPDVGEALDAVDPALAEGTGDVFWGSWNDYEHVEVDGQTYAKVGDRLYNKHAVDRMQPSWNRYGRRVTTAGGDYGRSVPPNYVNYVIDNSKGVLQDNGNYSHTLGSLQVIVNKFGAVVTIITK